MADAGRINKTGILQIQSRRDQNVEKSEEYSPGMRGKDEEKQWQNKTGGVWPKCMCRANEVVRWIENRDGCVNPASV